MVFAKQLGAGFIIGEVSMVIAHQFPSLAWMAGWVGGAICVIASRWLEYA